MYWDLFKKNVLDPDPHGYATFACNRNSENSKIDPDPE